MPSAKGRSEGEKRKGDPKEPSMAAPFVLLKLTQEISYLIWENRQQRHGLDELVRGVWREEMCVFLTHTHTPHTPCVSSLASLSKAPRRAEPA